MEIKKLAEKGNVLKVMVTNMDVALMNALRRSIMNAVPTFAAESVQVHENDSIIPDEMLCHRVALLPVKVNEKKVKKGDTVKLALEKEGPCTVYSGDIKSVHGDAEVASSTAPLVKLEKGQRIRLEIELMAGVGKEHAKWQPALVTYKQVPKVSFAKVTDVHAITKHFPEGELEVKAGKIFLNDPSNSRLIGLLREKFGNEVSVDFDTQSFVLTIESYQGSNAKDILLAGLTTLEEKNDAFQEALKKL